MTDTQVALLRARLRKRAAQLEWITLRLRQHRRQWPDTPSWVTSARLVRQELAATVNELGDDLDYEMVATLAGEGFRMADDDPRYARDLVETLRECGDEFAAIGARLRGE